MEKLTAQSFSDALYNCYNVPKSRYVVVFYSLHDLCDFSAAITKELREGRLQGVYRCIEVDRKDFWQREKLEFKNGSTIRFVIDSELALRGIRCDVVLYDEKITDSETLAYLEACERPGSYKLRKSLSYKPVCAQKEGPSEPESEALDAFLSEFSIMKS